MNVVIELIGVILILFMSLASLFEALRHRKYKKKSQNSLKKALFRYSINKSDDNLVDIFVHNEDEMLMVNKGNDLCDEEPDFKYYDYFEKLRNEERYDQNN